MVGLLHKWKYHFLCIMEKKNHSEMQWAGSHHLLSGKAQLKNYLIQRFKSEPSDSKLCALKHVVSSCFLRNFSLVAFPTQGRPGLGKDFHSAPWWQWPAGRHQRRALRPCSELPSALLSVALLPVTLAQAAVPAS